jgi:hypothetical protein
VGACQTIRHYPGSFERMWRSLMRRVEACIESHRGRLENLLKINSFSCYLTNQMFPDTCWYRHFFLVFVFVTQTRSFFATFSYSLCLSHRFLWNDALQKQNGEDKTCSSCKDTAGKLLILLLPA